MYLFAFAAVEFEGSKDDTVIACVFRASGFILAEPCLDNVLTAEKVGRILWKNWDHLGIPSVISSDVGPHFAYSWRHGPKRIITKPTAESAGPPRVPRRLRVQDNNSGTCTLGW